MIAKAQESHIRELEKKLDYAPATLEKMSNDEIKQYITLLIREMEG